jgi:hypothetical protein
MANKAMDALTVHHDFDAVDAQEQTALFMNDLLLLAVAAAHS